MANLHRDVTIETFEDETVLCYFCKEEYRGFGHVCAVEEDSAEVSE